MMSGRSWPARENNTALLRDSYLAAGDPERASA